MMIGKCEIGHLNVEQRIVGGKSVWSKVFERKLSSVDTFIGQTVRLY